MIKSLGWVRLVIGALAAALFMSVVTPHDAAAHPEDEFCTIGGGMDPALCRALQELDRAGNSKDGPLTGYSQTETIDFERPALETFGLYIKIGIGHILPGGLDHILFVLALVLSTCRLRPLLIQISAFTVAHTATLGLVAAGVFAPPASIVEPLIAATIAFVAIENLFAKEMTRWRPLVVFLFGLIHGMGFAGFFGTLGLPSDQFWSALLGFNVGVELGQLAIAVGAFVALIFLRRVLNEGIYRRLIIWPSCTFIGLTGLVWTIERLFFG
ncbi:MAG: hypothetical protein Hens3KO_23920 [Henriciella sp.]